MIPSCCCCWALASSLHAHPSHSTPRNSPPNTHPPVPPLPRPPKVYGLGSGLFFVGYSIAMVPAQLTLLKIGAPRALAIIVTLWGATAMAFSALSGKREFYVLRLLLGAFESGAFPAIWWVQMGGLECECCRGGSLGRQGVPCVCSMHVHVHVHACLRLGAGC